MVPLTNMGKILFLKGTRLTVQNDFPIAFETINHSAS